MSQKSIVKGLKDFRCSGCRSLLYKYKIHATWIELEVKCYSCNSFNTLRIELEPLFQIWNQNKLKQKEELLKE